MFLGTCRRRRRREGLGMRTAPKALNFRAMRDKFNSARSRCGGGRGRGGDSFLGACRRRRRRGGLGMRTAPKALNFRASRDEFNSALTLRRRARARRPFVPRRMSASAKARRRAALSTLGGLGRYWAAQWHLARAVGKRFRGCRAKRLYLHSISIVTLTKGHPGTRPLNYLKCEF